MTKDYTLLTLALLGTIFVCGTLVMLWLKPPVINITIPPIEIRLPPFAPVVNVHADLGQLVPAEFQLTLIHAGTPRSPEQGLMEEPIPVEMIEYCEMESDDWARTARKKRLRLLRKESGSWDAAFRMLQLEDGLVE